jgi:site-specific DNA recombinase
VLAQTFGPEPAVECLDEGVVGGLAGPGEVKYDPALVSPEVHVARDELAALIDADRLGIARRSADSVERRNDVLVSPKAIAKALNEEQIPGPRGVLWRDTAIRGHRQRGTGILNNELYIGRLIWNRLRYVKDPSTGKRVSRQNDASEWITTDVRELRIIDDGLWNKVKARQEALDATPAVQGIKASRFWERRRPDHLLTGLVFCGCCGGPMAAIGRDYLACSAARKLETCNAKKGIRRSVLEGVVLELLKTRLMQPEAVANFVNDFAELSNAHGAEQAQERQRLEAERATIKRKLEGLNDAIAEGLRSPGLKEKLLDLEGRVAAIDTELGRPAPAPVRLNPNLSELYRRKVTELAVTLADPRIAQPAREVVRGLIERVSVSWEEGQAVVALDGALTALIGLAQNAKGPALAGPLGSSVKVVAGAGFGLCRTSVNLSNVRYQLADFNLCTG